MYYYYTHFTSEKTEAWRSVVNWSTCHSDFKARSGLIQGQVSSEFLITTESECGTPRVYMHKYLGSVSWVPTQWALKANPAIWVNLIVKSCILLLFFK